MFTRLQQILGTQSRLPLLALLCLLLAASLAACQPKETSPQGDAAAQNVSQGETQTAGNQSPLDDPEYAKVVMQQNPEFTEAELLKAMADVQPVTHNGMDEVLDHLTKNSGWERNRAYYVLSKAAVSEFILNEPEARQTISQEYPQGLPTDKELDLVRKNRAAVHKGMDIKE